ncbi:MULTISPECIES: DEAD/DEAH box helicase [unclassified Bradyrhizobium]|uniref:DEAD/DEAH box helicase n=1 Tax=unclassified Bradyrhizobium TaxID=2631580 RepID=UPI002915EF31|nr:MULTISPECIES: AAA domain-containing protein [unclassified Bradyrhizobium]
MDHTPQGPREVGGLIAIRGFYYQWLYSLRLMPRILDGTYDAYRCEDVDDYLAWSIDKPSQRITNLRVVQVKHRNADECLLRDTKLVESVLEGFALLCDGRLARCGGAEMDFRLVYNPTHDCQASGCISAIERLDAYSHLQERMLTIGVARNSKFTCEPFLHLPHSKQEILSELKFLETDTPGLLQFFEKTGRTDALIKSIIGLIAPFHEGQKGPFTSDQLNLDRTIFDRTTARQELRSAINSAADRANDTRQRLQVQEYIAAAGRSARRDFQTKRPHQRADIPADTVLLEIDNPDDFKLALTKVHLLKDGAQSVFWRSSELRFSHTAQAYGLSQSLGDAIPLHVYLSTHNPHHHDRITLIRSLVQAAAEWSRVGAFLEDFRADDPAFQHLYFVKPGRSPVISIADLAVIGLDDPAAEGLLAADWVRGPSLGKAIRQIYYGSVILSEVMASALFRAAWNDNVVYELAGWLENALPRAQDLTCEIDRLFAAEICRDPFFVGELDGQFIRDCVNADIIRASDALSECVPVRLLFDRALGQPHVYFAAGEDSQIGLILRGNSLPTAHRLARYDMRRWSSARQRDHQMGVPAEGILDNALMFVRVGSKDDARNVAEQVFGVDYDRYRKWMEEWLRRAREHVVRAELPAILDRELSWINWQYTQLDKLAGTSFPFQLQEESGFGSGQSLLVISQGKQLLNHLASSGYGDREGRLQLNVRGFADDGREFQCISESIEYQGSKAYLTVVGENEADEIAPDGSISFTDEGMDAVLGADAAPLRILKASYFTPAESSPAPTLAWNVLAPLVGSEVLPPRRQLSFPTPALPAWHYLQGEFARVTRHPIDVLYDHVFRGQSPFNCSLVTGAAGTGKTALVADLSIRFLDECAGTSSFPPARIVVVASTHYALDNFVRVLRERSGGRHVPYRFVPRRGRDDKGLDKELYNWSQEHYKRIVSALLHEIQSKSAESGLQETIDRVQRELRAIETAESPDTDGPALIPSHEKWRTRVLGKRRGLTSRERTLVQEMVRQRLKALQQLKDQPDDVCGLTPGVPRLDPYACFAAPIIVTSVDALDRLPDVHCDLVIFEEASQLRLVKLFKVLTKLIRARGDGTSPKIVMSGDSRQLPPFLETIEGSDAGKSRAHATVLRQAIATAETPFEAIGRRNPSLVTILSRQHRMHPSVAELVRRLFYSDQIWELAKRERDDRVFWHDTSHSQDTHWKQDGTSRYNDAEIDAIARLVGSIRNTSENLLIVSPYAAQVSKLRYAVSQAADVQTIDGCQGRQAHSVIVSFVSLKFPTSSDFVIDPRRMNVAFSRASERLHLVGNLTELLESVAKTDEKYPHMAGLAALFGPGGPLQHCVLPALSL